ncbi:hypothetical protein CIPAW_09G160600 [Carya illinoinensis]|uniref:Uncharacterized protein n=1 Tax=Carya illinoinensis TaxID=32201 RepID=A0A8T1PDK9_CARIL|nr:hypothetical protein CIPAW_09G160600 [Carya illinoinensis]
MVSQNLRVITRGSACHNVLGTKSYPNMKHGYGFQLGNQLLWVAQIRNIGTGIKECHSDEGRRTDLPISAFQILLYYKLFKFSSFKIKLRGWVSAIQISGIILIATFLKPHQFLLLFCLAFHVSNATFPPPFPYSLLGHYCMRHVQKIIF